MRNKHFKGFSLLFAASLAVTGCKTTDWSKVKYEVTPNPLELKGDSVSVTVKGTIPPNVFAPKTSVTFMPVIKWNGGEKALKTFDLQGEKVKNGKGQTVNTVKGGSFTYTDKVPFQPEMKVSQLTGKAAVKKGSSSKEVDLPKLADGVSTTQQLVMNDEKPALGKDELKEFVPMDNTSDIHFAISQSKVRPAETSKEDVKGMISFLRKSRKESKAAAKNAGKGKGANAAQKLDSLSQNYFIRSVDVTGYASPDGPQEFNAKLAQDRGNTTAKFVAGEMQKLNIEGGQNESFFKKSAVAEDWDGLKKLVQSSSIVNKDQVLSAISLGDADQREAELKKNKAAWKQLASQILPQLRKSVMVVRAEKKARPENVISQLATSQPDSLTLEELLRAGSIAKDANTQLTIYNNVVRLYPNDWRGVNNVGYALLIQGKTSEAKAQFEKADKMAPNNSVVLNNLGVVALKNDDKKAAEDYFNKARTSSPEARYNLGTLYIKQGKWAEAVATYGTEKTFNSALAYALEGKNDDAANMIDASQEKSSASAQYLKAVLAARKGDATVGLNALKDAISKDASLKARAKDDAEFIKWRDNSDFKALVQ